MADISQITLPDGTTYDIKDPVARAAASDAGAGKIFYGVCSTAAATQTKVVTIDDFELFTGALIAVKFENVNTATSPKLNISGTGAINMYSVGTTAVLPNAWVAGETLLFVYNGTSYTVADGGIASTSGYGATKLNSSTSSTSTTEAATPSAVKQAYDLAQTKQNALTFDTIPTSGSTNPVTSGGIYTELETVKTSVSNGKSAIASAITDKGVSTSGSDSFATMANNISLIPTGSTGGKEWTFFSIPYAGSAQAIACKKGVCLVLLRTSSYCNIYATSDFDTWTLAFSASAGSSNTSITNCNLICYDDIFIFCGTYRSGSTFYRSSVDGYNWPSDSSHYFSSSGSTLYYSNLAYGNGLLYTVATSGNYSYCYYALTDFSSSVGLTSVSLGLKYYKTRGAIYSNGIFLTPIYGTTSNTGHSSIIKFIPYTHTASSPTLGSMKEWSSVSGGFYNGPRFVVVAENSNSVAYSNDGSSWNSSSLPSSSSWSKVIFNNGVFVALSESSNVAAYSEDGGVTWVQFSMPGPGYSHAHASDNLFVALRTNSSYTAATNYGAYSYTV